MPTRSLLAVLFLLPASWLPCLAAEPSMPASGTVSESEAVPSKLLGKDTKYAVYLPPGYAESDTKYPILYLLHGRSGNHLTWLREGKARQALDTAVRGGEFPPTIVVMPDAGLTYYMNDPRGERPFEDHFFKEFLPHVEAKYRVRSDREHRAVAGLSMGGYGSLLYTLRRPDLFGTCCALSAAVRTDEELENLPLEEYRKRYGAVLGEIKPGEPRVTDHWKNYGILRLVPEFPAEYRKTTRFLVDCGDDDHLSTGNAALHIALRKAGIVHEYRVRDGGHTWAYWRESFPAALKFIARDTK